MKKTFILSFVALLLSSSIHAHSSLLPHIHHGKHDTIAHKQLLIKQKKGQDIAKNSIKEMMYDKTLHSTLSQTDRVNTKKSHD